MRTFSRTESARKRPKSMENFRNDFTVISEAIEGEWTSTQLEAVSQSINNLALSNWRHYWWALNAVSKHFMNCLLAVY